MVETPIEAATVLMIAAARMSEEKRVTDRAEQEIVKQLTQNMPLSNDDADSI